MKKIVIAIDGFSSCGKSTFAKAIAARLGYIFIDTGAMYRAVALYLLQNDQPMDCDNLQDLLQGIHITFSLQPDGSQHTILNGEDVEHLIRTLEVGNMASKISPIRQVRQYLVAQQQAMGQQKAIVMDGRDIGTVVFPNAELKLFLTASPQVRAKRRYDELKAKGENPIMEDVLADINDRDYRDSHRTESPLRQAEDAVVVDNSNMTREEQMKYIIQLFSERCATV